jgi:hypothetical protein
LTKKQSKLKLKLGRETAAAAAAAATKEEFRSTSHTAQVEKGTTNSNS